MLGFGKKKKKEEKAAANEELELLRALKKKGWDIGGCVSRESFEKMKEAGVLDKDAKLIHLDDD